MAARENGQIRENDAAVAKGANAKPRHIDEEATSESLLRNKTRAWRTRIAGGMALAALVIALPLTAIAGSSESESASNVDDVSETSEIIDNQVNATDSSENAEDSEFAPGGGLLSSEYPEITDEGEELTGTDELVEGEGGQEEGAEAQAEGDEPADSALQAMSGEPSMSALATNKEATSYNMVYHAYSNPSGAYYEDNGSANPTKQIVPDTASGLGTPESGSPTSRTVPIEIKATYYSIEALSKSASGFSLLGYQPGSWLVDRNGTGVLQSLNSSFSSYYQKNGATKEVTPSYDVYLTWTPFLEYGVYFERGAGASNNSVGNVTGLGWASAIGHNATVSLANANIESNNYDGAIWRTANGTLFVDGSEYWTVADGNNDQFTYLFPYMTLTYDGNGGTAQVADSALTDEQPMQIDEYADFVAKPGNLFSAPTSSPTLRFKGWSLKQPSDAKGTNLTANDIIVPGATVDINGTTGNTLYAVWEDADAEITLDPNGGSGSGTVGADVATSNDALEGIDLPLGAASGFTKSGKVLVGWSTTANPKDITTTDPADPANAYKSATVSSIPLSEFGYATHASDNAYTLYAVWEDAVTYNYTTDGTTGASVSLTSETVGAVNGTPGGSTAQLAGGSGKVFKNWTADNGDTANTATFQPSLPNPYVATVTYTANFRTSSLVVTLDYNGGKDQSNNEGVITIAATPDANADTYAASLPTSMTHVTDAANNGFAGWKVITGGGPTYNVGDTISGLGSTEHFDEATTLQAQWSAADSFDITLVTGVGSISDTASFPSTTITATGTPGSYSATLPTASQMSCLGYTFVGWSADGNTLSNGILTSANACTILSTGGAQSFTDKNTTTLYAIYDENVSMRYVVNGGYGCEINRDNGDTENGYAGSPTSSITITAAKYTSDPDDIAVKATAKNGYKFLGWTKDNAMNDTSDTPLSTNVKFSPDVPSTDYWFANFGFDLTIDYNGGTHSNGSGPETYTYFTVADANADTHTLYGSGDITYDDHVLFGWSQGNATPTLSKSTVTSNPFIAGGSDVPALGVNLSASGNSPTFYAVWDELVDLTFTIDSGFTPPTGTSESTGKIDGGTADITKTVGKNTGCDGTDIATSAFATPISTTPDTGANFDGWYLDGTKVGGAGWSPDPVYTDGDTYKARFVTPSPPQHKLTLKYQDNNTTPDFTVDVAEDDTYLLPTPTWSGHHFVGWGTSSTVTYLQANNASSFAATNAGGNYTMGTSDVTLYAVWDDLVDLTFASSDSTFSTPATVVVKDGATDVTGDADKVSITTNASAGTTVVTVPKHAGYTVEATANAATAAAGGTYEFMSWHEGAATGPEASGVSGTKLTLTDPAAPGGLGYDTATYTAKFGHRIKLDYNNGSNPAGSAPAADQDALASDAASVSLPTTLSGITNGTKVFAGWSKTSNDDVSSILPFTPGISTTPSANEIAPASVVYAVWDGSATYTYNDSVNATVQANSGANPPTGTPLSEVIAEHSTTGPVGVKYTADTGYRIVKVSNGITDYTDFAASTATDAGITATTDSNGDATDVTIVPATETVSGEDVYVSHTYTVTVEPIEYTVTYEAADTNGTVVVTGANPHKVSPATDVFARGAYPIMKAEHGADYDGNAVTKVEAKGKTDGSTYFADEWAMYASDGTTLLQDSIADPSAIEINQDVVFKAKFEEYLTVSYKHDNDGIATYTEADATAGTKFFVKAGDAIPQIANSSQLLNGQPKHTPGYRLTGWTSTDTDNVTTTYQYDATADPSPIDELSGATMGSKSIELVPSWTKVSGKAINFKVVYKDPADDTDKAGTPSTAQIGSLDWDEKVFDASNISADDKAALTTLEGFDFKGWYHEDESGEIDKENAFSTDESWDPEYGDIADTDDVSDAQTVFLYFEAGSVDITFHDDGPEDYTASNDYTQTATYGTAVDLDSVTFTKAGYEFAGWQTDPEMDDPIADEGSYTPEASGNDLYATWTPKSYKITYDANFTPSGSDSAGTLPEHDMTYDDDNTATLVSAADAKDTYGMVREGWRLTGWKDGQNNEYPLFDANGDPKEQQVYNLNDGDDVVMYAQWVQTFTISFDLDGAEDPGTTTAPDDMTIDKDGTITLPGNADPEYEKAGYETTGWTTATDGSGTHYDFGATYPAAGGANGDATLYLDWQAGATKLTIERQLQELDDPTAYVKDATNYPNITKNAKSETAASVTDYSDESTTEVTYVDENGDTQTVDVPTPEGFELADVSKTAAISSIEGSGGTLVLKYDRKTYSITYVDEGKDSNDDIPAGLPTYRTTDTAKFGEELQATDLESVPSAPSHYSLEKTYWDSDDADVAADGSFTMPANDVELKLVWDRDAFTVSFEAGDTVTGATGSGTFGPLTDTVDVKYNDTLDNSAEGQSLWTAAQAAVNPATGYFLSGWEKWVDGAKVGTVGKNSVNAVAITADTVFKPVYSDKFSITWETGTSGHADFDDYVAGNLAVESPYDNIADHLLPNTNDYRDGFGLPKAKPGYKFAGWDWTDDSGDHSTTVSNSNPLGENEFTFDVTDNLTVTARFDATKQTITLDLSQAYISNSGNPDDLQATTSSYSGSDYTAASGDTYESAAAETGENITLPAASEVELDGYTLVGWRGTTNEDGTVGDHQYAQGATEPMFNEDATLYPVFEEDTITLTYKTSADDTSVATVSPVAAQTVKVKTGTPTPGSVAVVDLGYELTGWKVAVGDADPVDVDASTGTVTSDKTQVTPIMQKNASGTYLDLVYTAQLDPRDMLVQFDADSTNGWNNANTVPYGKTIADTSIADTPAAKDKEGYTQSTGTPWQYVVYPIQSVALDGTVTYAATPVSATPTKVADYTAVKIAGKVVFEPCYDADEVDVTFDKNGGTSGSVVLTGKANDPLTADDGSTYAKYGYDIDYWADGAESDTKVYELGASQADPLDVDTAYKFPTADATVYAHWVPKDVTFNVNLNGGTCEPGNEPESFTAKFDATATAPADPTQDEAVAATAPEGKKFAGWNTKQNGDGTAYDAEESFTVETEGPVTLYAQWEDVTYKLVYDANAEDATGNMDSSVATGILNSKVTVADNDDPGFARTDYAFNGWVDADGADVAVGSEITLTDENTVLDETTGDRVCTLYATWKSTLAAYDIYFADEDGNVITEDSSPYKPIYEAIGVKTMNADYPVADMPDQVGMTFLGWSPIQDATGESNLLTSSTAGVTVNQLFQWKGGDAWDSENNKPADDQTEIVLYPVFEGVDGYKVKFIDGERAETQSPLKFTDAIAAPAMSMAAPDGTAFLGWFTTDDADGEKVAVGDGATVRSAAKLSTAQWEENAVDPANNKTLLLYAKWVDLKPNPTYEPNDEDDADHPVKPGTYEPQPGDVPDGGQVWTDPIVLPSPERPGYTFEGWQDGDGATIQPGASYQDVYGDGDDIPADKIAEDGTVDLTLKPVWNQKTSQITYVTDDNGIDKGEISLQLEGGARDWKATDSEAVPAATGTPLGAVAQAKPGWHFVNWTVDYEEALTPQLIAAQSDEGPVLVAQASTSVYSTDPAIKPGVNADNVYPDGVVYTANFERNGDGKVTFDSNGGTGSVDAISATIGTDISLPSGDPLQREHYTFGGWELPDGSVVQPGAGYTVPGDVTVKAHWVAEKVHVVIPDYDNPPYGKVEGGEGDYDYGTAIPDDLAKKVVPGDGYELDGWHVVVKDSDGNVIRDEVVHGSLSDITLEGDTTLTPVWKAVEDSDSAATKGSSANDGSSTADSDTSGDTAGDQSIKPKTGDPLVIWMLLLASVAIAAAAVLHTSVRRLGKHAKR